MSGTRAARRSRRPRSLTQITEACWRSDFEEAEAKSGAVIGDAEIAERLQEILPGLAGCDDADPGVYALADYAIEAIGARIGERGRQLMIVEPLLLRNRVVEGPRA